MEDEILSDFVNGSSSPHNNISINYINSIGNGIDAQSIAQFVLSDMAHGRDVNITNTITFINSKDDNKVNHNVSINYD